MRIKQKLQGDIMVMELSGKLVGGPNFDKVHLEIKDLLDQGNRKFILDFSGVAYISSIGLGMITASYQSIRKADGILKLCSLNKRTLSVFYVTKLDLILDTFESREDALQAFA